MSLDMAWYDWTGIAGTLMVLLAFLLLQVGRLSSTGLGYLLLNLFGAAGLLLSLLGGFNVSVFLLEGAWLLISLYGLMQSFKTRKSGPL